MIPSVILSSAKKEIPFYFLDSYIDNTKADGDFKLADTEEAILKEALSFYAANGNPNITVEVPIVEGEEPDGIDFPSEFSAVIQIRDLNMETVPYSIVDSKIVLSEGYQTPFSLKYRYKLEDYFTHTVDVDGNVVVTNDKDIPVEVATLIKRLVVAILKEYNSKIEQIGQSVQMDLPATESQGERALAENAIRDNVRIQPSLFTF